MKSQFTRRNNIMSFNNSILKVVSQILPCILSVLCTETIPCPENAIHPNLSVLQTQLNDWRWEKGVDAAIFIHPRFLPENYTANIENTDTGLAQNGSLIMALSRDRACPRSISQLSRRRVERQKASCPFYYELDFNPDRFPETIVTARCKCAQCVGTSAKSSVKVSSKCEAVSIYQKVLRIYVDNNNNKGCDDKGVYKYRNSFQKVNVGCMCVYNRTKKAAKPDNPRTGAT